MNLTDLPERLQRKIEPEPTSGCWIWSGSCFSGSGYGQVQWGGGPRRAHRLVYELLVGPIPPGLDLDHKCRVRPCVNPAHVRPCTCRENLMAPGSLAPAKRSAERVLCEKHGIPYHKIKTQRVCRECRRAYSLAWWRGNKEKAREARRRRAVEQ